MNNVLNEANTSHGSWNNLSMQEKAAMIRVAVKNGLTDLKTIREKYNEFAEGGDIYPSEEMNEFGGGGYIYDVLPGMLKKAGLDIRVSSGYRPAGKVGTSGKRSWHWRHGAVDIVPQGRTTFEDIERVVSTNPEIIQYMTANGFGYLDETNRTPEGRALMKKTGATGNHFHFGKDTRARERYQAILGRGNAATLPVTATSEVIAPTAEQPIVPFFMPSNPQVFFSNPVTTNQPVVDMEPTNTPMLEYDPKEAERQEKRDNLSRFNMFLGMLNGSNESTFPFSMFAEGGGIHIKPENRGKFTALKERTGHSATWFKEHGTPAQKKMATFALNSRHWKHSLGGNLFEDGGPKKPLTRDDLRRMLLNRRAEAEAAYNGSVTETQITPNDNAWVDKPLTRRKKNPHSSRRAEEGAKAHAAWEREHPNLAAWGNLAGTIPFAVAAAPLGAGIVAGGDALAATTAGQAITSGLAPLYQAVTDATIAGAPALAWADAGLTSAFGAHGISQAVEEGGISPMTALELAPLGRLAKPIYNASSKLGADVVDKVKWLYNEGNVFNAPMKYNPENFYRLVGKDAIEDANLTGIIRANPNSNFKVPYFGYKRGNPSTRVSNYDDRLIIEGSPNSAETWADSWRYDSRRDFIKNNLDNLTSELKTAESPEMAGLYTDEEIQALHKQRAFWNDLFKNKYRDVRETPTTRPLSTQYFEEVSKNRPGWMIEFRNEAFPSNAGSTSVPNDNFIYWQKYPLLGWRPNSFKTASGSRSTLPRVPISTPEITAENAASITPEQWTAAQDAAIARGDIVEAQRLRDLHARTKEYDPIHEYHGSNKVFEEFNESPHGIYFTPDEPAAKGYMRGFTPTKYDVYLNKGKDVVTIDNNGLPWNKIDEDKAAEAFGISKEDLHSMINYNAGAQPWYYDFLYSFGFRPKTNYYAIDQLAKVAKQQGKTSLNLVNAVDNGKRITAIKDKLYDQHIVFKPNQIKSADAVTYDDNGVRIPLGNRDNFKLNDIRYGLLPFLGLGAAGTLYGKQD